MKSKKCTKCGVSRKKESYYVDKQKKDGLLSFCKSCCLSYRHTIKGVVTTIYSHQRMASRGRGHVPPPYTNKELLDWVVSQKRFSDIFREWKISGYGKDLSPSIDRLDDYEPYTFSNIQLTTWCENRQRGYDDRKSGVNNKVNKPVVQRNFVGKLVGEYYSLSEASRRTGVSLSNISGVCCGERKTAGGFLWVFKQKV